MSSNHHILHAARHGVLGVLLLPSLPAQADASGLALRATWSDIKDSSHGRHATEELRDVLQPDPAHERQTWPWDAFAALLPSGERAVGDVWRLPFEAVAPFLRQLHPNPRERSHMGRLGYPGVHATLLAKSPERIDVLLRAHVEFELRPKEVYFTFAQFEGRLIVDPALRRVVGLRLGVPARSYNYDVHIRNGQRGSMLIDIGYVPDVGVRGGELPAEDAAALAGPRRRLRQEFYPFEKVEWLTLADGLARAADLHRPLHLIT